MVCRPVIIAGSGPSLSCRLKDIAESGIPVAAVSTAIRVLPKPDYWVLLDDINHHHGGQKAFDSARDESVRKVTPCHRHYFWDKFPNVEKVDMSSPKSQVRDDSVRGKVYRKYFDGRGGVLRAYNRSMTFCIQWAFLHFNCAIFCGMDHRTDRTKPYVYSYEIKASQVNSQNHNHRSELAQLIEWRPIAHAAGYIWLDWNVEGSPMKRACHGVFNGRESLDSVFGRALEQPAALECGST